MNLVFEMNLMAVDRFKQTCACERAVSGGNHVRCLPSIRSHQRTKVALRTYNLRPTFTTGSSPLAISPRSCHVVKPTTGEACTRFKRRELGFAERISSVRAAISTSDLSRHSGAVSDGPLPVRWDCWLQKRPVLPQINR